MGDSLKVFVSGVVAIGIITALFLPGRETAKGILAAGSAGSNLLGTAISGNK